MEKKTSTYSIKLKFDNPYIGSRNGGDKTLCENLTLKSAYAKLLDLYNDKYGNERPYARNWGIAVIQSKPFADGAVPTFKDGTRAFSWDSRIYSIEIEED